MVQIFPFVKKQGGSELKGKFYHLTEQNQPRRACRGLFRLPVHPICFLREPHYRKHGSRPKPGFHFAEYQSLPSGPGTGDPPASAWASSEPSSSYDHNYVKCTNRNIHGHQRERAPGANTLNTESGAVPLVKLLVIFFLLFNFKASLKSGSIFPAAGVSESYQPTCTHAPALLEPPGRTRVSFLTSLMGTFPDGDSGT